MPLGGLGLYNPSLMGPAQHMQMGSPLEMAGNAMLSPGHAGGYFPPAPSPQQRPQGLGGFLQNLFNPNPAVFGPFGQQQRAPVHNSDDPMRGMGFFDRLRHLSSENPGALMALGAGMMEGDMAGGFRAASEHMSEYRKKMAERNEKERAKNVTLRTLGKDPMYAAMLEAGVPTAEVFKLYANERGSRGKPPQVETFYDPDSGQAYKAQWNAQTNAWEQVGGTKAGEGLSITLPDGTTVQQGTYGNQDVKNVANRVTEEQEIAAAGTSLKQTVGMLRKANEGVGYSGPLGGLYGGFDNMLEGAGSPYSLPGNSGDRAVMTSGGLDVALSQVQKTKGAISNAEMGLFMAAAPGLQNTPQGNAALLDMIEAVADRQVERASAMETYRQQYGTLDGFEQQWASYIETNPLIVQDGGGIRLNKGPRRAQGGQTVPQAGGSGGYRILGVEPGVG